MHSYQVVAALLALPALLNAAPLTSSPIPITKRDLIGDLENCVHYADDNCGDCFHYVKCTDADRAAANAEEAADDAEKRSFSNIPITKRGLREDLENCIYYSEDNCGDCRNYRKCTPEDIAEKAKEAAADDAEAAHDDAEADADDDDSDAEKRSYDASIPITKRRFPSLGLWGDLANCVHYADDNCGDCFHYKKCTAADKAQAAKEAAEDDAEAARDDAEADRDDKKRSVDVEMPITKRGLRGIPGLWGDLTNCVHYADDNCGDCFHYKKCTAADKAKAAKEAAEDDAEAARDDAEADKDDKKRSISETPVTKRGLIGDLTHCVHYSDDNCGDCLHYRKCTAADKAEKAKEEAEDDADDN